MFLLNSSPQINSARCQPFLSTLTKRPPTLPRLARLPRFESNQQLHPSQSLDFLFRRAAQRWRQRQQRIESDLLLFATFLSFHINWKVTLNSSGRGRVAQVKGGAGLPCRQHVKRFTRNGARTRGALRTGMTDGKSRGGSSTSGGEKNVKRPTIDTKVTVSPQRTGR